MAKDFSIDINSEHIHNKKTKGYFEEILQTYFNGNFRATIVMLYSVVICDLLYKLKELDEVYSDEKAKEILSAIKDKQKNNPKSSEWENELLSLVSKRTSIFKISTYENISILQKHRHLCAHPVLDGNYSLYSPNKETTRAHLRNMLEDIFLQRPSLSKDIFSELVSDIADKRDYFPPQFANPSFEKYLKNKYFQNAPSKTIQYIFKNLWKITFRLEDPDCRKNRDINYNTVYILYKTYKNNLESFIESNNSFFSNINKGYPAQFLISFLSIFPEIYSLLEEHAQIILKQEAEKDSNFLIRGWFFKKSIKIHLDLLKAKFEDNSIDFFKNEGNAESLSILVRNTESYTDNDELVNFVISIYINSGSFYKADYYFSTLISPNIKFMSLKNIEYLLSGIEENEQVNGRFKARTEHSYLKSKIDSNFEGQIDYKKFPKFLETLVEEENDDMPF